jgi:hypothetical protein
VSVQSRLTVGELIDWLATMPRHATVDPNTHCVTVMRDGVRCMEFNYRVRDGEMQWWPYDSA